MDRDVRMAMEPSHQRRRRPENHATPRARAGSTTSPASGCCSHICGEFIPPLTVLSIALLTKLPHRPKDSPLYQAIVVLCVILLVISRAVNMLVPLQLGVLVDSLGYGRIPYKEIVLYVIYRALQGNQGILGAARSVLWIPVSQSLFRRLSCAAFEHVLGLSLDFHLSKKIGEVTSALSRGAAMNTFLENFVFQVFPMIFDIFAAGVLFFVKYDAFYTIIVFFIMWSYIFLTIYMSVPPYSRILITPRLPHSGLALFEHFADTWTGPNIVADSDEIWR